MAFIRALFRPDFEKLVEKLVKMKGDEAVRPVLNRFLDEHDLRVIETKVLKVNGGAKSDAHLDEKAMKKERKKREKREKKDAKEKAKQDNKEQKHKSGISIKGIKKLGTLKTSHKEPKPSDSRA